MSDIVHELRYAATDHDSTGYVMEKAAAEIERLRAHQDETAKAWTKLTESQEQEIERLAWSSADLTQKKDRKSTRLNSSHRL